MIEKVKKALLKYHTDMEKAEAAKSNALAELNRQYEVRDPKKAIMYVPAKIKSTQAYSDRYNEILNKYESTIRECKKTCKAEADEALTRAKADIIVFSQKAPSDDILNSIKALETMGAKNITKEEILMLMENSRNYLACKALAKIADDADQTIPMVTLADVDEILKRVGKEIDDFFAYYNPLSYKTMALVNGNRNILVLADNVLDDFVKGYFTRGDNALLEAMNDLKLNSSEEERKAKEAHAAEVEKKASDMTEVEKLALYLN